MEKGKKLLKQWSDWEKLDGLPGTPAKTGWTQPETSPQYSMWRPPSNQSLSSLSVPAPPWTLMAAPSHCWRQRLDPITHQPLCYSPAHGNISVMRKAASFREPVERAEPRPRTSPQEGMRAGHTALSLFKDRALCATETTSLHRCSPARRLISASAATPLSLPKSSCSISPLQRVVVYFGMLFLFCKKYFVFV